MLKRLELAGFKSFARKTEFDLTAPISAVVGPNGSGKSNVAEGLRWVLGEQSLKSLRGKRGEDFIFNGSRDAARMNHASVTLIFDNRARKLGIDFDEVALSRHVFRDGTNEYYINGSVVRLKDIIELLGSVGIGVSSHNIISQGEADRLLSSTPRERREMIEDALGLKVFHFKREEALRKLEKTEENMRQVDALRRELGPHLKYLKKQVERLEEGEKLREELKWLYAEYFTREKKYLDDEEAAVAFDLKAPEAELLEIEKKIATAVVTPVEGADTAVTDSRNALQALERDLYNARLERDELGRELGRLEGKIEALPVYKEFAGEKVCSACGQVIAAEARDRLAHREEEIMRLTNRKGEIEKKLEESQAKEAELSHKLDTARLLHERALRAGREAEREVYVARVRKSELVSFIDRIMSRKNQASMRREDFTREVNEALRLAGPAIADFNQLANGMDLTIPHDEYAHRELKRKLDRVKLKVEDIGGENWDALREYREASEREAFLEKETTDLTASSTQLHELIDTLGAELAREFEVGLRKINEQFAQFFAVMFDGGSAKLAAVLTEKRRRGTLEEGASEEDVETEEGIEIEVNLPRKKIRGLDMLSGGERALTSIALLFAMSQVNPPPFLVLDETDAALDESNSRRYGDMIERLSESTQLVLITHNRETMSRAHILYGVTMGSDAVSRVLSVKFEDAATQFAK